MRHRFHSLCPYFAMFPEAFVEKWVGKLTGVSDTVLDPFCGRGTTPFQALLMGREAIASDINPVAYCVTRAKTNAPPLVSVASRLEMLEQEFNKAALDSSELPEFFSVAFHEITLAQLLFLRTTLDWRGSEVDCMIAALILGCLHGEISPATYLSNQMPRTISTKPAYSIRYWADHAMKPPLRDVFGVVRGRAHYRYESQPPLGRAVVINTDMRELPRWSHAFRRPVRCAITSPPYLDVTSFEEDQWLRLWFLGGESKPTRGIVSRDDRHSTPGAYWRLIADMWRSLGQCLSDGADVVVRLSVKGLWPAQVAEMLLAASVVANRNTVLVEYESSEIVKRQTRSFRPGSTGCKTEVDCHFKLT